MTCQSSESPETSEGNRRADDNAGAVESDESRIAAAMKELRNTGGKTGGRGGRLLLLAVRRGYPNQRLGSLLQSVRNQTAGLGHR